ncbi:hypothetical protein HaLaN_14130 [Haematococcus lacustris]|uniref:Uncharacterized protein n=1 Tax=Haematococcus lacustris TaxID=44745 RepID=A0A699Z5V6_HAELA|nr:hypothetical protein HaLaN_14130 [Haematococcus lacustris]
MLGDPHEPPAAAMMRQPEVGEVSAPPPARPPRPGFFPCPGPHLDLSAASGPVWVSGASGGPGTPWGHTLRKNELAAGLLAGEEGEERERLILEKLAAQAAAGLRRHWAQSLGPAASPRGVWVKQPPLPLTGPHAQVIPARPTPHAVNPLTGPAPMPATPVVAAGVTSGELPTALPDAATVANSSSAETQDAPPWRTPARFQSRNDPQPPAAQRQARRHGGIRVRPDKGRQHRLVQLQETAVDALVLRASGGSVVLQPLPTINTSHSPPRTLSPVPSYSVALPTLPASYSPTAIAAQGQEVQDTRPRGRTTSYEAMRRETQAAFLTAAQSSQSAAATFATLFAVSSPQQSSPPQPRLTLASQRHKYT